MVRRDRHAAFSQKQRSKIMDLQVVSPSELETVEGGFNLAWVRNYVELNPQPLPPGGPVELNPQPLPPGEMRMASWQFA
jgi:hypothetical protein